MTSIKSEACLVVEYGKSGKLQDSMMQRHAMGRYECLCVSGVQAQWLYVCLCFCWPLSSAASTTTMHALTGTNAAVAAAPAAACFYAERDQAPCARAPPIAAFSKIGQAIRAAPAQNWSAGKARQLGQLACHAPQPPGALDARAQSHYCGRLSPAAKPTLPACTPGTTPRGKGDMCLNMQVRVRSAAACSCSAASYPAAAVQHSIWLRVRAASPRLLRSPIYPPAAQNEYSIDIKPVMSYTWFLMPSGICVE